jgi:hypothetical protein
VKLPFFSEPDHRPAPAEIVSPPWQTLMLVCIKCKGSRRGPDARGIRKGMKQRLGKQKQLRILESECLGVCPDDAVTVCTLRAGSGETVVRLVRTDAEVDALAASVAP